MIFNTAFYWGIPARLFHWTAAGLILFLYFHGLIAVDDHDVARGGSAVQVELHAGLGVVLGLLMLARYLWRLINQIPMLPAKTPEWEKKIAGLAHIGLYVATFAAIVPGLLIASSLDPRVKLFGLVGVPRLFAIESASTRHLLKEIHEFAAHALIVLVVVHVFAALYHHYIQKDSVLRRMLLRGRNRSGAERPRRRRSA